MTDIKKPCPLTKSESLCFVESKTSTNFRSLATWKKGSFGAIGSSSRRSASWFSLLESISRIRLLSPKTFQSPSFVRLLITRFSFPSNFLHCSMVIGRYKLLIDMKRTSLSFFPQTFIENSLWWSTSGNSRRSLANWKCLLIRLYSFWTSRGCVHSNP